MKMGVGTRIVFTFFLLIVMALCVAIILASFGAFAQADLIALWEGFLNTGYKYIWAAAALVLFITALCLMFFGIRSKTPEPRAVVLEAGVDSSVSITLDALRELAARYLKDVPGILTNRIHLRAAEEKCVQLKLELLRGRIWKFRKLSGKLRRKLRSIWKNTPESRFRMWKSQCSR